jgi:hypothetical protein
MCIRVEAMKDMFTLFFSQYFVFSFYKDVSQNSVSI